MICLSTTTKDQSNWDDNKNKSVNIVLKFSDWKKLLCNVIMCLIFVCIFKTKFTSLIKLSLHIRFPHAFTTLRCNFFYNISWFCSIKVRNKKFQCNVENACRNRMCKQAFSWSKIFAGVNSINIFWVVFHESTLIFYRIDPWTHFLRRQT